MSAVDALSRAGLKPIEFGPKEALAIANAASVAASLSAINLFDTGLAILLTQAVTGLAAEAMTGRLESFDKTVHDVCLPHTGNIQVKYMIEYCCKYVSTYSSICLADNRTQIVTKDIYKEFFTELPANR